MLKDIPDEQGTEMDQLGVSNIRYSICLFNDNEISLSNQELLPSLDSPPIRGDVSRPSKPELSAANLDETPMKREETPPPYDPRLPVTVLSGFLGAGKTALLNEVAVVCCVRVVAGQHRSACGCGS